MRFMCSGVEYDTDEMTAYQTGNSGAPWVYQSADEKAVFIQTMDRIRGVEIHRASVEEIHHLARACHLPQLLKSLDGSGQ